MATLRFANLGSTPGDEVVSPIGDLYILMTEDSPTALVFDLRSYISNPPHGHEQKFKRIGPFEIAILPKSRLRNSRKSCDACGPFKTAFEKLKQVYVVNLSGAASTTLGWEYFYRLFPKKTSISRIPLGKTDWNPIREEEPARDIISTIESTDLVNRGEKTKVGPFTLFLFRSKEPNWPASILITGETMGSPFAFFFGDCSFGEFFWANVVKAIPSKLHSLSAGTWHSFYSLAESPPVKELCEQT